jgi:hypothetical protein
MLDCSEKRCHKYAKIYDPPVLLMLVPSISATLQGAAVNRALFYRPSLGTLWTFGNLWTKYLYAIVEFSLMVTVTLRCSTVIVPV